MRGLAVTLLALMVLTACSGTRDDAPRAHFEPVTVTPADFVQVDKSSRKLRLFSRGSLLREYPVALGFSPEGHKRAEGDGRTPEGLYVIDRRNPQSQFHLSLGISYPNAYDRANAEAAGFSPGGNIFIHGQPNGMGEMEGDWTAGCIALSDMHIREVWSLVPDGVLIQILP